MENVYFIDGKNIYDLNSFYKEFARAVNAPNGYFGKCLNSFDDCLFGSFGLEAPCKIVWKNSDYSKKILNNIVLLEYYEVFNLNDERILEGGKKYISDVINKAKNNKKTMFDEIVELIKSVTERSSNPQWIIKLIIE